MKPVAIILKVIVVHVSQFGTLFLVLLYLPSDFRVAYAANISEHLAIEREIDHHTGNYVPYSFRTVCWFFYVPQN